LTKKDGKYFSLERKEYLKYLGVLLDEHLTWKHRIDYVASKISKTVGIIARLRHFVPFQVLTSIYIIDLLYFFTCPMVSIFGEMLLKY
jgi:hypothetical protein